MHLNNLRAFCGHQLDRRHVPQGLDQLFENGSQLLAVQEHVSLMDSFDDCELACHHQVTLPFDYISHPSPYIDVIDVVCFVLQKHLLPSRLVQRHDVCQEPVRLLYHLCLGRLLLVRWLGHHLLEQKTQLSFIRDFTPSRHCKHDLAIKLVQFIEPQHLTQFSGHRFWPRSRFHCTRAYLLVTLSPVFPSNSIQYSFTYVTCWSSKRQTGVSCPSSSSPKPILVSGHNQAFHTNLTNLTTTHFVLL